MSSLLTTSNARTALKVAQHKSNSTTTVALSCTGTAAPSSVARNATRCIARASPAAGAATCAAYNLAVKALGCSLGNTFCSSGRASMGAAFSRPTAKRDTSAAASAAPVESAAPADSVVTIPANGRIVLIGITGATGRSALQGLLSVAGPGRTGHTLVAMTRNPAAGAAKTLPPGVQVVGGDLDEPVSLGPALQGADAVYCHALSKDAVQADPQELVRARHLAHAAAVAGVKLIMYNSSGGRGCGYGISQMEQKHAVEDILAAAVPTVALQATLFMEELWKRYTRPGILAGKFTWSTPSDRPIQLVAARDLGLVAGSLLSRGSVEVPADASKRLRLRALELAGDELSPQQMCDVFAQVQGRPVVHNRAPAWPFWFIARDVFRIARFLTERGYRADVAACREQFPGMLTFRQFLEATGWADPARTFEDGIAFAEKQQQAAGAQQQQAGAQASAAPPGAVNATRE